MNGAKPPNSIRSDDQAGIGLKRRWEERAFTKGATFASVLYRGFSERLNLYIHEWHVWAVTIQLLPQLPRKALVLDLGCGYGRIRQHVTAIRPDLQIVGMDLSENYCHMYAPSLSAKAVCADMNHMPFAHATFDAIIGVTCLMYLPRDRRAEHISRILDTLKPSGYALFVDPGLEFMQVVRFGLRSTRKTPTGGEGFLLREYRTLDPDTRFRTCRIGGIPVFTALLPLLYLLHRNESSINHLLEFAKKCDFTAQRFMKYALQRWVLLGPSN